MIRPRQHGAAAGFIHNRGDLGGVGGDHHRAKLGRQRAAQDMHDHRLAGDIGERFAREPGRRHAGGNEDKDISHRKPAETSYPPRQRLIRVARRAANRLIVHCPPVFRCGAFQR